MFSKVKVKKGALDYFRKLARQSFPYEIQAYLIGKINSIDEVEIVSFAYTKKYSIQTKGTVAWYVEDYNLLKENAENAGYKILGDIHTHPSWDAVLSPADYKISVLEQQVICGICSVNDKKTRVRFWTPASALPCRIIYT